MCFVAITASRLVLAKMKLTLHHPARHDSSELSDAQLQAMASSSIEIIEFARELRTHE
jgi:hypothetical protein